MSRTSTDFRPPSKRAGRDVLKWSLPEPEHDGELEVAVAASRIDLAQRLGDLTDPEPATSGGCRPTVWCRSCPPGCALQAPMPSRAGERSTIRRRSAC